MKWIQDIKIRKLVFIQSLYDYFLGFCALQTIPYMHVEGNSRALREDAFGNLAPPAINYSDQIFIPYKLINQYSKT